MSIIQYLFPALLILIAISGCGALQSDAVRDLSASEVKHLDRLQKGFSAASNRKQVKPSGALAVEVGLAKSMKEMTVAWSDLEKTFVRWDEELLRLRTKGLAPIPVPPPGVRNNELADLMLRALEQQEKVVRLASDYENSCLALIAAEERINAGVAQMLDQAKHLHSYLDQSAWALSFSSLDVASVGGALGEFDEGRRLLEFSGKLTPKIVKTSGQAQKAISALGLDRETTAEIETLMGIMFEHLNSLQAQGSEEQTDNVEEAQ